jgi:hypothetical protein
MEGVINAEVVTYDFARLMDGATEVKVRNLKKVTS